MGDKFGSGMFEAFRSLIHKKKKDADPKYDGSNPKNEDQVMKDLENLGVIKAPVKKTAAEERADLLKKGTQLGVPSKEMEQLTKLKDLRERVQRREMMIKTRVNDLVKEVREEVPSAAAEPPPSSPVLPHHKEMLSEQRIREDELDRIGQESAEMRRKRDMEALAAARSAIKDLDKGPRRVEEAGKEVKLDLAIKEFGLKVDEVELEAGKLTEEIKREVVKARRRAADFATPDEYWKTLDSRSLTALDELYKRGRASADLKERLIRSGVAYGLDEKDLRAITDRAELKAAVYQAADRIIDQAMAELPLERRKTVRDTDEPVLALKKMLEEGVTAEKEPRQQPRVSTEDEKEMEFTRRAADITFARFNRDAGSRFEELNPADPGKRDEAFLEKTRQLWKEFAVHGISTIDTKTGKQIVKNYPDLDGRTCLGLLQRAGIDTRNVEFVAPGESVGGKINLDTGYRNGLAVEDGGDTAYFDHHAPENGHDISSAKVTYEVLTKLGLLKPEEHLSKLVEFVTHSDNKTHPARWTGFKDSYRTVLGLQRYAKFYQLEEFFKSGLDPAEPLTDAELKKFGLEKASREQKLVVEQSEKRFKEMEQQGLIVDSKEYGRIVVDIGKTLRGGVDAAGGLGAGCYVIWNPETKSFFVSSVDKPLTQSFGQGKKIRGSMWIKEMHDPQPLKVRLSEVLNALAGEGFEPTGELKRYLDAEAGVPQTEPRPVGVPGFDRDRVESIGLNAGLTREQMRDMSDMELVRAARSGWEQRVADFYSRAREEGQAGLPPDRLEEVSENENVLSAAESSLAAGTRSTDPGVETAPIGDHGHAGTTEARVGTDAKTIKIEGRVIDLSEVVKNLAQRQAEQQMTELMNKSHFYNRWWIRMNEKGRLNMMYREAVKEITENKVLLTTIEARMLGKSVAKRGDENAQYKYLDAILESYEKDFASEDEKGQLLVNPDVNSKLADLFYRHAKGEFGDRLGFDRTLNAELMPTFERLAKEHPEMFTADAGRKDRAEGLMFAQNFWMLAESYKDRIAEVVREHGGENEEAVRNYLNGIMSIDVRLGLKQKELYNNQPEAKLGMLEKVTDKLQAMPFGLGKVLANPVLFGGIGSMFGQSAARASIRGAAMAGVYLSGTALFFAPTSAALLAGGLAGGAFMWYRRSRDLKYDRGMDARRQALGELSGGKRTDKIREFAYSMASAQELTANLNRLASQDSLSDEEKAQVADVMARLSLEKKLNADLISVSEQAGREGFRITEMNPLLASLKGVKEKFGLTDAQMQDLVNAKESDLVNAINSQDKEFESFRKWESAKAAVIGGAMGIAGGVLSQWGIDQLRGHGIPGFDKQKHGSMLEGAYHWLRGEDVHEHAAGALVMSKIPGTNGSINLPEGYEIVDQSRGNAHSFGIKDPNGSVVASGIEIGQDGQLSGQSLERLKGQGFEISDVARKIRGDIEIGEREVANAAPSVEEMRRWLPKLSEHARADWHDEAGMRYSNFFHKLIEFEGKQQMLYLDRDPQTGMVSINAERVGMNLIENAKKAFAEYGTNPDGSVDTKLQHLMKQLEEWTGKGELGKHLQAAVIPTEGANGEGLSLLQEGALPDGRVPLPRETWEMFRTSVNLKDGHLPFKYLEFRLDGHVLATAQGHDLFTASGGPGVTKVPFANPSHLFVHDTNIRPPLNPDAPIPTPFFPRKHLEKTPLVPPPQPPYYGYGASTPEQIQARMERDRIEPQVPERSRDVERERSRLNEYLSTLAPEYRAELTRLEAEIAPMDERARVAVNIPAYNEEPNLRRLLDRYTQQLDDGNQPLDPRLYEINVILNRPAGTPPDRSAEIINQFKREHPEFRINLLDVQFPREKAGVGLARKYVTDLTLLRSLHRSGQEGALYIQSEDADLLEVDPRIIRSLIKKFDGHPEIDALRGQQDRYPEILMENDMLFLNRRAEDYWETLMRDKKFRPEGVPDNFVWNRVVTGGWNTAYTAEVYAQIRGYSPLKVGEDMDIGQRISMLRGSKRGGAIVPNVETVETVATRSHSSPRRYIDALARGIDPYSDFENESVKFKTTEQLMERISPYRRLDASNTNQLERLLEGKYRYMIRDLVKDKEDAQKMFGRLMYHLGFRKEDWALDRNDNLKITSIAHVKKALSDYRKDPKYLKKMRIARGEGRKLREPAGEVELRREEIPVEPTARTLVTETPAAGPASETLIRESRASEPEPAGTAEISPRTAEDTTRGEATPTVEELDRDEPITPERQATRAKRAELYKERSRYLNERFVRLDKPFVTDEKLPSVETSTFLGDLDRHKDGKMIREYADAVLTARYRTLEAKIGPDAPERFEAYMQALGFRPEDWSRDGKDITVKSTESVKAAISDYRNNPKLLDDRTLALEKGGREIETAKPLKKAVLDSLKKRGQRVWRERYNLLKKTVDSYSAIRQKKDLAAMADAEAVLTGIYQGLPEGPERMDEFMKAIAPTGISESQIKIDESGNVTLSETVNQRQLMRKLKPNMFKKALDAARKGWGSHKKDLGL